MSKITSKNFFEAIDGKPYSTLQKIFFFFSFLGLIMLAYTFIFPLYASHISSFHNSMFFGGGLFMIVGTLNSILFTFMKCSKKKKAYQFFRHHLKQETTINQMIEQPMIYNSMIKEYFEIYSLFYYTKKGKLKSCYHHLTPLYGIVAFINFSFSIFFFIISFQFIDNEHRIQCTILMGIAIFLFVFFLVYFLMLIKRLYQYTIYFDKETITKDKVIINKTIYTWAITIGQKNFQKHFKHVRNKNRWTYAFAFPSSTILIGIPFSLLIAIACLLNKKESQQKEGKKGESTITAIPFSNINNF